MAGIPVIAQITRQGGANFPIAVGEDIKGAFVTVADTTARDAIPTNILRTGAICRIANTSVYYEWNGSAWISLSFGGGTTAIDWKESVRFATTTALAASTRVSNTRTANANGAFPTVDGVTAAIGNRFLDKDHATGADRGIWEITSLGSGGTPWVIARSSDADTSGEVTSGMGFVVAEGSTNGGKVFLLTTADPITLNTTSLTFTALSGTSVTAGNGITDTAGTFSVDADGGTLTVAPAGVKVSTGGISATELASNAVTTVKITDANVTTAKVADAAITAAKLAPDALPTKPRVLCVATSNIASTSGLALTIDGIAVNTDGQRVLLTAQTSSINNGIWIAHSGAWTRAVDMAASSDASCVLVVVQQGTIYADTLWICTTDGVAVVGTDILAFAEYGPRNAALSWAKLATAIGDLGFTGLKGLSYTGEVATTGATPAVNFTLGDFQKTTLTTNAVPVYTAPAGVCSVLHHVVMGGSGSYTMTFPSPLIGSPPQPSTGVGDHTYYGYLWDGTNWHYSGGGVTLSGTTLSAVGSGIKLRNGAAAGQQWLWDGSAWQLVGAKTGSALGDASVTLQFATANQYLWPAATNTTAIRTLTIGTTGLAAGPNAGVGAELTIDFLRSLSHNVVIANGGGGGGNLFTLPSGSDPCSVTLFFDGTNWSLAGWRYLGTVTAA